ncbi:MAG: putative Ig domain-containing protein, partial [Saezia sp.]
GNDTLFGGDGNDSLNGRLGDDMLYGEDGNDWFIGNYGNDVWVGGSGSDIYFYEEAEDGNLETWTDDDDDYCHDEGLWGKDIIYNDDINFAQSERDVIRFGLGVKTSEVILSRTSSGNLVISFAGVSDTITVDKFFNGEGEHRYNHLDIKFRNGTIWNLDTIIQKAQLNHVPVVSNIIEDLQVKRGEFFTFVLPENLFTDPDGDVLTLHINHGINNGVIPSWFNFNATTRTFSAMAPTSPYISGSVLYVFATDKDGLSVSQKFTIRYKD